MKLQKPTKLKSGVYCIRLRLNGTDLRIYGQTEAECRRNATAVKADHQTGRVVQSACSLTTEQAIEAYIAGHPKLSPSTIRGYTMICKHMFPAAQKTRLDAVKWQAVVDAETHSPKTVKNAWGLIRSVHTFLGLNPPQVKLPALPRQERPFLDPQQVAQFVAAIRGAKIEVAALLGLHSLRRSEILDVTWSDIDLEHNLIHVRGAAVIDKDGRLIHKSQNKNASSTRDVPIMIPRLKELLAIGGDGYVVACHPNTIIKSVNSICRAAGLPEVGCHGLRHSFISLCYHLGWSELACMRVAGFSDYQTMRKIYTHLAEQDKAKDVSTMRAFFGGDLGAI